jgi:hypothetical protein
MNPYANYPIWQLVQIIRQNWKNVNYAAAPYLDAMSQLETINDDFGLDSGVSVVLYFLSNAAGWRGPIAKEVKAELKRRCK